MNTLISNLPVLMAVPEGAGGEQQSPWFMFITFGLVIAIFYFLIIRPQNKKQKETKQMLEAIKKGDKVVTIGGINGTVHSVSEEQVVLKVDDTTKLAFTKNAISNVINPAEAKKASEETKKEKEEK